MVTLTPEQIAVVARNVGWSKENVKTAVAVALSESGGAVGTITTKDDGSKSYGLWQINDKKYSAALHEVTAAGVAGAVTGGLLTSGNPEIMCKWYIPSKNAEIAHNIQRVDGWKVWPSFSSGQYLYKKGDADSAVDRVFANPDKYPNPSQKDEDYPEEAAAYKKANPSSDPLDRLTAPLESLGTIASGIAWLTDVNNLRRLALILGGGIISLIGAGLLASNTATVQTGVKAVKAYVTKGASLAVETPTPSKGV